MSVKKTLKGLQVINLQGVNYFGTYTKTETGVVIENAIVVRQGQDFQSTITEWIKAENLGKLETVTADGNAVFVSTKPLTEEQEMTIDIVAAKAAFAKKYALANLENQAIDNSLSGRY